MGSILRLSPAVRLIILLLGFLLQFSPVAAQDPISSSISPHGSLQTRQSRGKISPSSGKKEHVIKVGWLSHTFDPDSVTADVGDVVRFDFYPTNHSVVQADYEAPCLPREMVDKSNPGFFSGFFPMSGASMPENPPSYWIKINNTEPIWFYCSSVDSCNYWGMVGVINPTREHTLSDFKKRAKEQHYSLSPGENIPDENTNPGKDDPHSKDNKDSLSTGAIVGIVIGAVVVALGFGFIFWTLWKWRKPKEKTGPEAAPALSYNPYAPGAAGYYSYGQMQETDPRALSYYSAGTAGTYNQSMYNKPPGYSASRTKGSDSTDAPPDPVELGGSEPVEMAADSWNRV